MHYANGREAKVGDPVVGKVYNTKGIKAGTLVSLTPGPDACSAQIEFFEVISKDRADQGERPQMHLPDEKRIERGSEAHGSAGEKVAIFRCRDYTHAGNLLHVEDAAAPMKEMDDRLTVIAGLRAQLATAKVDAGLAANQIDTLVEDLVAAKAQLAALTAPPVSPDLLKSPKPVLGMNGPLDPPAAPVAPPPADDAHVEPGSSLFSDPSKLAPPVPAWTPGSEHKEGDTIVPPPAATPASPDSTPPPANSALAAPTVEAK